MNSPALQARGDEATALEIAARGLGLPAPRTLGELCVVMTYASNLPMLLHWEDRNSMAHSIEARVPFLDPPLVDFSLGLADAHKMRGVETKSVLREAMRGILPESIRARRDKLGFATPEQGWFRGPLRGLVHEGVEATLSRYPGLLDAQGTRALRDDMLEGRKPVDFALWRIVSLGHWGERFSVAM
jgi:asparagine synthase (glutamine-hydrolysing)